MSLNLTYIVDIFSQFNFFLCAMAIINILMELWIIYYGIETYLKLFRLTRDFTNLKFNLKFKIKRTYKWCIGTPLVRLVLDFVMKSHFFRKINANFLTGQDGD